MKKRNKYILYFILLMGLITIYYRFNPIESIFFPKCIVYSKMGYYCAGCGSQRTIHHLLNFDIKAALQNNILVVLVFFLTIYDLLILALRKSEYQFYKVLNKRYAAVVVFIIIITFTIARNINYYPFNLLAPH